jgi:hypothetical protein
MTDNSNGLDNDKFEFDLQNLVKDTKITIISAQVAEIQPIIYVEVAILVAILDFSMTDNSNHLDNDKFEFFDP